MRDLCDLFNFILACGMNLGLPNYQPWLSVMYKPNIKPHHTQFFLKFIMDDSDSLNGFNVLS